MPTQRHNSPIRRRIALVAVGVLAAGLTAIPLGASADSESPAATAPADDAARGLVLRGLELAAPQSACAGGYAVTGTGYCSHGPDPAPPGLNVKVRVAPVAGSNPPGTPPGTAAAPPAVGTNGIVCDGDGTSGKRVQVVYLYGTGTASRFTEYLASFRTWAAGVDTIYEASAQETGGSRHVRYVTTADCQVDVREAQLPPATLADFGTTINGLQGLGFNRTDRKYMIFTDSAVYCGIGTFIGDDGPTAVNPSNLGPSYGRIDSGCWNAGIAAHELGHNLGAVNNSAPHSTQAGHCVDEYDVMCYKDTELAELHTACPDSAHDQRLDCNHDDYYHTNPSPGSYLATHWNIANNQFLLTASAATALSAPNSAPPGR